MLIKNVDGDAEERRTVTRPQVRTQEPKDSERRDERKACQDVENRVSLVVLMPRPVHDVATPRAGH